MSAAEYLEMVKAHAAEHNFVLSEYADRIAAMLEKSGGHCPCKHSDSDQEMCPCSEHYAEIEEMGHCTCNLFLKKE